MWVVETTVIAGEEGEEDESKDEDGWATWQSEGKMNMLNAKSLLPRYNLSASTRCAESSYRGLLITRNKREWTLPSFILPASDRTLIWSPHVSLRLHLCLLLTRRMQAVVVFSPLSIDLRRTILFLMTGWLPMRKHFITARYSRQVERCREQSIRSAHTDFSAIGSRWNIDKTTTTKKKL